MSEALGEGGITLLEFARRATLSLLEDVPDDKLCHQPIPGANHALWIMGHLAHTDNYFLTSLAGQPTAVPESWDALFGMGSKPTGSQADYPAPGELRDRLASRREALIAWFRSLDGAVLLAPLPEELRPFAPNHLGLAGSIAWHEGMHMGQLTVVRKSLGIGPKFG